MSIKRTIITTVVTLALVAMIAPGVAQGVTIEELLAQISQLQSQLLSLQGGTTGGTTGTVPSACVGVTFSRNLVVGSTGSDVKCLQAVLNLSATTKVATTGAGSPGAETTYFGSRTLAAVKVYQAEHGWTPANQVGPMTRQALNATLAGGTTGGTLPAGCTSTSGFSPTTGQSCGTGTGPVIIPTGAGLTVQLAYDNPASSTLVTGTNITTAPSQSGADLAHFTFVNGDNAEVKVTGLKLKRIGIGADATLANVYLYDGAVRLTDAATVSETIVSFNDISGLFTVPAGGSKTIRILSDIALSATGQTLGVQVVAATSVTTNASSVKGTFPVSGNLHTTASATLSAVDWGTATPSSSADVDPQNDYVVWSDTATVSNHAVNLTRFAIRQTGSALPSDIQNLRLYVNGVQVGSAVANVDANGYATWDLSASPVRLETGARTIKILADIIGGSSKNFIFSLRSAVDANFVDTQVGISMIPTGGSAAFTTTNRTTGTMSISSGTLSITKDTDSPSGSVVNEAANAVLAKYTVKAAGEPVKIETLDVAVVCSVGAATLGLRNGAIYANGVQVGSTATLNCTANTTLAYTQYSLGSSLIVNPGSPVTLEVRADVHATGTTIVANTDTFKARIVADTGNAEGRVSKTTINVPATAVDGNTITARKGGLTLSKYTAYTDQSMVPPLTAAKIGHFTLTANTTEAVNVTTIQVNLNPVVSSYASNLYVTFGDKTTSIKPSLTAASNEWSVNYSLAAGETKDLIVYADLKSTAVGTGYVSVYVAGTTASSSTSTVIGTPDVYTAGTGGVQGQAIAMTTGTFTPAVNGDTPPAAIVAGGQQVVAGKYQFSTLYDSYTISDLRFTVNANTNAALNSAAIVNAIVKDGDTVLKCGGNDCIVSYDGANAYFNFTGLSVAVPTNTTKVLTLVYDLSPGISSTSNTSQVDVTPTLDFVKYENSQGTQACVGTTDSDQGDPTCSPATTYATSKELYAFKSIPAAVLKDTVNVPATGTITAGNMNKDLYGWTVKADTKGDITVKQVKLTLSLSDAGGDSSLYLYAFKLYKNNDDISSLVTITDEDGHDLETATAALGANENSSQIIIYWTTEDTIGAGKTATYRLSATTSGFKTNSDTKVAGDDTVSVSMPTDTTVNGATIKYLTNHATLDYVQLCTSAEGSQEDANFIWSDKSALDHGSTASIDDNDTASSSGDWANGRLVQSLPLSTNTYTGP